MSVEPAVAAACRLREALLAEVEEAREERRLLRRLDGGGLLARAAARARFLARASALERELAAALAGAARALGLGQVTLEGLERARPEPARRLAAVLGDVRSLAGALREIDQLNAALARRALSCVDAYVGALLPAPRAYGRAGARAVAPALLTVSTRG